MNINELQIDKYFHRINFEHTLERNGETLRALQHAHLTSVPYENLDILNGIPLSMKPEDLFKKIVDNVRGGYCFELNGIFAWLLKGLGFNVTDYFARFLLNEQEIPKRRHRVLKVEANDGVYICDIGVGIESPRYSLKLLEGLEQADEFSRYKFTREPFFGWVLWQCKNGGQWNRYFSFTEEPQLDIDFIMPSFYCEKHPDSPFNKSPMLSLKTEKGRQTVDGKQLKFFEGEKLTNTFSIYNENACDEAIAFRDALKKYFNISL